MLSKSEMLKMLLSLNLPEYTLHNKDRIISCINDLQENLSLKDLKTLDLGHDSYVGLLLAKLVACLCGNVPLPEFVGTKAPPEQTSAITLPDGEEVI
jgi:hypothetical protein